MRWLLLLAACHPLPVQSLPARSFGDSTPCQGLTPVDPASVSGIFLRRSGVGDISPEAGGVPLLDVLSVTTKDGSLLYNDGIHEEGRQSYRDCKLAPSSLSAQGIAGALDANYRFTPVRDVRVSLDSGFGARFSATSVAEDIVFRPDYDTNAYAPYARRGPVAPTGETGVPGPFGGVAAAGAAGKGGDRGVAGQAGARGADGTALGMSGGPGGPGGPGGDGLDGAAGSGEGGAGGDGSDGGDGGAGGDGGIGFRGGDGGRAADGQRGEVGPRLQIEFRPIFSPFYPGEELVYADVVATWSDLRGNAYQTEELNYVFHHGQPFTFRSVGGDGGLGGTGGAGGPGGSGGQGGQGGQGGAGGDGGAGSGSTTIGPGGDGGDGGNGGVGGKGGAGAVAGCGGPGGNGGRAGDGGRISVRTAGDPAFRARVAADMRFESVPGNPGGGGPTGASGISGAGGNGGSGGYGGSSGSSGSGNPSGSSGNSGATGNGGAAGASAFPPSCRILDGAAGGRGVPGPITVEGVP